MSYWMFLLVSCTIAGMEADNRKRLGRAVIARRTELGMRTTKALADRAALSPRMLGDVENGRRDNFSAGAKAQIERALKWAPGSIDTTLSGGDPTPLAVSIPADSELVAQLRQPPMATALRDESDSGDYSAALLLDKVLNGEQLQPEDLKRARQLVDDQMIKTFPTFFKLLSRAGKLDVARYAVKLLARETSDNPSPLLGGTDIADPASDPAVGSGGFSDAAENVITPRPANWNDSPPPPGLDEDVAASEGPKDSDDEDDGDDD